MSGRKEPEALKKEFRSTGLVVGCACAVVGALQWLLHGRLSGTVPLTVLFAAAATLVSLALIKPALLRPFHFLWMKLADGIGRVMNFLILGLLFFVFFTLTGWLARAFGRDLLQREFRNGRRKSYWVARKQEVPPPERYERQF
jgi:hypothetical protein